MERNFKLKKICNYDQLIICKCPFASFESGKNDQLMMPSVINTLVYFQSAKNAIIHLSSLRIVKNVYLPAKWS